MLLEPSCVLKNPTMSLTVIVRLMKMIFELCTVVEVLIAILTICMARALNQMLLQREFMLENSIALQAMRVVEVVVFLKFEYIIEDD